MPELPEVEHLRRCVDPHLVGASIERVEVRRKSVIGPRGAGAAALLCGARIARTDRRGKQLAIVASDGRAIVVQLGMTGSLAIEPEGAPPPPEPIDRKHRHVVWLVDRTDGIGSFRLVFRDPRRFGGVTAIPSIDALAERWSSLGPDALAIEPRELADALARTGRPIKSALLDQAVLAGVGNIYADESLFAARIHPLRPARSLARPEITALAAHLRRILIRAAGAGGSTLRDYRDPFGNPGSAVQRHQAYGREGLPCRRCDEPLEGIRLQGRATVFCPRCQDLST
jgi:formamidopyrimidine-DNA glycosylase